MKRAKKPAVRCALGFAIAIATGHASAGNLPFEGTFSGTTTSTPIDQDGNGALASSVSFAGNTTLGPTTVQGVTEEKFLTPVVNCPQGQLEYELVERRDVIRFASGDLLIADYSAQTVCIDGSTGNFSVDAEGSFGGGTGLYANATGSFEATASGQSVLMDPARNSLTAFTAQITGTIVMPEPAQ